MDGLKGRLSDSLQLRLSLTLSVAIAVAAVVAGTFAFLAAFDEAIELQDDVLRQVAGLLARQGLPGDSGDADWRPGDTSEESRVIVQRLGPHEHAQLSVDAGGHLNLPMNLRDGLQTLEVDGENFRVLVRTQAPGERFAVAQESGFRDEIARASALRTLMPFLLLMPILPLITTGLVRRMFRPVALLARDIDRREQGQVLPIDVMPLPREVRPFGVAINRLLDRVGRSMDSQRRFVADAAHELRMPLAALSVQAGRLAGRELDETSRGLLAELRRGIQRASSLLEQMLALAKAQDGAAAPPGRTPLLPIIRDVLQDLMPQVEAKSIDIGVVAPEAVDVPVSALDLTLLVRNLVDNAVRYTPAHGQVDIRIESVPGELLLRVQDSGLGLSPDQIERIFDPFYRVPGTGQSGSGLGLTIVKAVAERNGIRLRLASGSSHGATGLTVEARIPLGAGKS